MHLRVTVLASVAVLATGATALAQSAQGGGWSTTATPSWVSEYVFRGQLREGSSFQPQVEADSGGAAIGVWSSFPHAEIDGYGTYTAALSPTLSLEPGLTLYTYPQAEPASGGFSATVEPNFAVNWTVGGVRLTPKVYYDLVVRAVTGELNASAALPLSAIGTELDLGGNLGGYSERDAVDHPASGDVRRTGGYWLLQASVPYQFWPRWRASVSYAYTEGFSTRQSIAGLPGSGPNPYAASRGFVTVSLSHTF